MYQILAFANDVDIVSHWHRYLKKIHKKYGPLNNDNKMTYMTVSPKRLYMVDFETDLYSFVTVP